MRTGARPAGKSPARGRARARSKGKKKSPPRGGPRQFRPELAGERACASAHRRPSPRLPSVGGLARCSAIPASPEARALGVSISRALCGEGGRGSTEGGRRRTGLGKREKPPSPSEERGQRAGVCRRHASIPHAPRGCGSTLETPEALRRQVDYNSQKAARPRAYSSRQHLGTRPFSACCRLGRNYSSQEASREAAWKWAAWKSLGPQELAASPASGADLDTVVVGPAARAAGTPRYVAPGAGSASRKGGGESVSPRTPRVSAGGRLGGRPGVGTGCWGRRRRDSSPLDLAGLLPACFNFPDELPGAVAEERGMGVG